MQQASGGRFEPRLGRRLVTTRGGGSGLRYPPPGERVERYAEALQIVSTLLETRHCRFSGTYYQIDIGPIGPPVDTPPTLTASLGGPSLDRSAQRWCPGSR
ncbi:MAG: LLM class flavin-dependent oxidoreductase [Acidimicrobiales bacterium]